MSMHQLSERTRRMIEVLREMMVRQSVPAIGIEVAKRGSGRWESFENGGEWGRNEENEWMDFRFTLTVPSSFQGKVVLRVITGKEGWEATKPQFLAWVNGEIVQGIDTRHTALLLSKTPMEGERYEVFLEGYANAYDVDRKACQLIPPRLFVSLEDVCEDVEQLAYDLEVPYQAVLLEEKDCRDREKTLFLLSEALNLLDLRNPYSKAFHASIQRARDFLWENYYEKREETKAEATADCIGHTHIDVAWLWDLYQTRHKAARSFASMLKLMEEYPEFKFMSSQPQLYQFVKEDHPELFARIQEAVKRGQWEPEGGMWVEADCNVTGGESLVRQFLYGNEFFEAEFGKRSKILWLPDVFGYSAALPQIMKKSGIDFFMTSKLSWSEFNCAPYDTFLWKGIDGSEVLTHFTPARDYNRAAEGDTQDLPWFTTYNTMLNPSQVKGGWQRFQQKGLDNHFLVSYGYGDGGGGVTDWMLENARRMRGPVAGVPAVRQTFPTEFFAELEKRVMDNPRLPKWSGELYLEYHRGTYTAMGRNKRSNRKLEIELRETEALLEAARLGRGLSYPEEALREIWRQALTLQFHDILPGSSIEKVYEDSRIIYEKLFARAGELKKEAMEALGEGLCGDVLFFNSLSFTREDVVWFTAPEGAAFLRNEAGNSYPIQRVEGKACAFVRGLRAMALTPFWFEAEEEAAGEKKEEVAGGKTQEAAGGQTEEAAGRQTQEAAGGQVEVGGKEFRTPFFSGRFDEAGRIVSLVELSSGRELVKKGEALNRLVCYENYPHNYDAWDINVYYKEHSWEVEELLSSEVICHGPVLSKVRHTWRCNKSTIIQDTVFYHDLPRIDFETKVDWVEKHSLLKAHFPVDVFYNEATFDIQYGNVRRPAHQNTSWDTAKFEVCAHKWADVSEGDFGFALMNDCKYGHSVDEKSLALTLLKSSTHPNPTADQEEHVFTYSIMPHLGDWRKAGVPGMAYQLNMPVTAFYGGKGKEVMEPLVGVNQPGILVECVKRALKEEATVVRLYECYGSRTRVKLRFGFVPKKVFFITMMEDQLEEIEFCGQEIELEVRPYEIVSLLARL